MLSCLAKFNFLWSIPPYAPRLAKRTRSALILLAALLLATVQYVEYTQSHGLEVANDEQNRANRRMLESMSCIRAAREAMGIRMDLNLDPNNTGLIGVEYTDLTSTQGSLSAKRTSLNPQFASLALSLLRRAGAQRGDRVALCFSGSFPALNIAVLAACEEMGLTPFTISSVGASAYGANIPGLTWLDMERILFEQGRIGYRSAFVSLGGIVDTEGGIDGTGIELGLRAIRDHGAVYLDEGKPGKLTADIDRRMQLYFAGGRPAVFVNIGGNVTSLGWVAEAARLENGLLRSVPACRSPQRGIIFKMMEQGVPVIHLLNIERLAARYFLPIAPVPLPSDDSLGGKEALERRTWWQIVTLGIWLLAAAWLTSKSGRK
jgi:poly-gamma-glutamate system protein